MTTYDEFEAQSKLVRDAWRAPPWEPVWGTARPSMCMSTPRSMIPITTNSMPGSARVREDDIDYVTIETRSVEYT